MAHFAERAPRLETPGLISAVIVGIVGALVIFVTPGFLALIAAQSGLDDAHLGYIAAWDIDATAVAIGVSAFLLTRCNWRWVVGLGLVLIALGNVATALATGYGPIALARVLAGTGEGIAIGFSFAALGRARNPDRAFSIYLVAGAAFSSLLLFSLPMLQERFSPRDIFVANAVIALLSVFCLAHFPNGKDSEDDIFASGAKIDQRLAISALVAVFLYFFATGAMWSYTERIGISSGLKSTQIANGLSIGTLAGVVAAGLAGWVPTSWGRTRPLLASGVISVVSFWLLLGTVPATTFILATVMLLFGWNFAQPLLSGICAEADSRGRIICLMASIQTFGMGLGPAAVGGTLGNQGFTVAIWSSCFILALSLLIVAFATRGRGRA